MAYPAVGITKEDDNLVFTFFDDSSSSRSTRVQSSFCTQRSARKVARETLNPYISETAKDSSIILCRNDRKELENLTKTIWRQSDDE